MMNKGHFGFFFILLILLTCDMMEQTEGWGCDPAECDLKCIAAGYPRGGQCINKIRCVCKKSIVGVMKDHMQGEHL
ncbi:unnamed protein product [Trifolium pratense]|uniref:Uncharacterized protein n=1 Tax=Trifolium pratense TaxID=57577 RepID=A0ACB0J9Y2_TRIPR|nr:unnamed protein product [Trifolium pratense]